VEIRGTITKYNTVTEKFVVTVDNKPAVPDADATDEAATTTTEIEYTEKELTDQFDLTIPPPKYTAGLLVRKVCVSNITSLI
jgi:hypothetical protein